MKVRRWKAIPLIAVAFFFVGMSPASATVYAEGWYSGLATTQPATCVAAGSTINIYWSACANYEVSSRYGQSVAKANPSSAASGYANVCTYYYNPNNQADNFSSCPAHRSAARLNFTTVQSYADTLRYCYAGHNYVIQGDTQGQQSTNYATYTASLAIGCG